MFRIYILLMLVVAALGAAGTVAYKIRAAERQKVELRNTKADLETVEKAAKAVARANATLAKNGDNIDAALCAQGWSHDCQVRLFETSPPAVVAVRKGDRLDRPEIAGAPVPSPEEKAKFEALMREAALPATPRMVEPRATPAPQGFVPSPVPVLKVTPVKPGSLAKQIETTKGKSKVAETTKPKPRPPKRTRPTEPRGYCDAPHFCPGWPTLAQPAARIESGGVK